MNTHCADCHRPGQVAPFPLTSYQDAAGRAAMIREVVDEGRMPPWSANPKHGRFANDPVFEEIVRLGRKYRESLRPRSKKAKRAHP